MTLSDRLFASGKGARLRAAAGYALELCLIGMIYFVLAKSGLALASIHPNATPIWPKPGLRIWIP